MTGLFLELLNMCIAASWLALAIILIRLIFKNMPKWISCLLWGILALRLILPAHFQSPFSLIPSAEVIPQNITVTQTPAIYSGIPAINNAVNPMFVEAAPGPGITLELIIEWGAKIWLIGVAVMLLYCIITYFKLYRTVRVSLNQKDNIYICDDVKSPFLLGILRPRIYVPSDMDEESMQYVLLHENAHIKRHDHWWKPLGFLLLCIYWYNPILWLAYSMLCLDIERACDEKVITKMDNSDKAHYSAILAACSIHPRLITACPVAFGETAVKTRIKGVLRYKKPALWIVLISVIICALISVCFLTDPLPCLHNYTSEITLDATCTHEGVSRLTCTECQHCYSAPVDIIDHSYAHSTVTEPTCTHTGTELLTCTSCGIQHTETLALLPHVADGQVFVTESNCTVHGEISIACSQCNTICSTEVLPTNNEHDLHETVIREATCAQPGEGIITCSRCDYSESCTYPALEHHYVDTVYNTPTCISSGAMKTECTQCGDFYHTWLEQTMEHNFVYWSYGYECCTYCGLRRSTDTYSLLDGVTGTSPFVP
ncbi:MAG: hypothetical protein IJ017_05280 [Oscillospiraceae bacterium]|nr:hypothetical protein [Oscillospiraceae bacterium]